LTSIKRRFQETLPGSGDLRRGLLPAPSLEILTNELAVMAIRFSMKEADEESLERTVAVFNRAISCKRYNDIDLLPRTAFSPVASVSYN